MLPHRAGAGAAEAGRHGIAPLYPPVRPGGLHPPPRHISVNLDRRLAGEVTHMPMRTHELHPSLVHAPLVLLPVAAIVDLMAAARPRDRTLDRMGRGLWWATAVSGLGAGLAGMAASQEIDVGGSRSRDMMFLHGMGNLVLVLSALGVATLRSASRATVTTGVAGLAATGAAFYTAYLGGELVYSHGAGVKATGAGERASPLLFSREAPARLAVDAGKGLAWLLRRAYRAVTGRERIEREALGPIAQVETPLPAELVTPPETRSTH